MLSNRSRDTGPELRLRSMLHARGRRFRIDHPTGVSGVRSHPDVVFTRQRVAVYVDGCFWHRCPEHGTMPKRNQEYWKPKLDANVERDLRVTRALEAAGWTVLRFWEHQDPAEMVDAIEGVLDGGGS